MSPWTIVCRIAAVLVIGFGNAFANTWYVDASATPPGVGTQANPYTSIQYAHDQATTLDTDLLLVAPGTYVENVTLSKRITVQATGGAEVTTLRPAVVGPILTLNGPVDEPNSITFEGFRITGVFGPQGTEAVNSLDGKLLRCIVSGNRGNSYVGLRTNYDGNLVDCTIVGNDVGIHQVPLGYTFLRNTVVYNIHGDITLSGGFIPDVEYCVVGNPAWAQGTGNIVADPEVCNPWVGDTHVRTGSPCIDAGDPALPNDPDGSRSDIGYHSYDPQYDCGPFTPSCPGDGTGAACPCGNSGSAGRGCDNSSMASQRGASLYASGTVSPDTVVLHAFGEMPTALTIFLQGNATSAPGLAFGDGLRCASGVLKRLYVKSASGGAIDAPTGSDPSITARSAALGDPIPPGERRYYQTYYRDANPNFCPAPQGNTFNASSSVKVVW